MVFLDYLLRTILQTFNHILILFLPVIILGLILHYLSLVIQSSGIKIFGIKFYLYGFAALGTAIHELGHAIFCPVFGHKIIKMKLFEVNYESGNLGYVNHSYNQNNLWSQIGSFFIGIGPIILGSLALFSISYFLFEFDVFVYFKTIDFPDHFYSRYSLQIYLENFYNAFISFFQSLINVELSQFWKIVLIFYLFISVGSSINLSPADIRSAAKGLGIFILLLFALNLTTMWQTTVIHDGVIYLSKWLSGFYLIMLFTISFLLIIYLLFSILEFVLGR